MQSFDIMRLVSVYHSRSGVQWWTKAWFNNDEKGEPSVEIPIEEAIKFINDEVDKDEWMEEYFPEMMKIYHQALEKTKEQLLTQAAASGVEKKDQQRIN